MSLQYIEFALFAVPEKAFTQYPASGQDYLTRLLFPFLATSYAANVRTLASL